MIVIVDDGLQQGFIFEPGQVELEYVAFLDAHPRDTRDLKMRITGPGRMAAALELLQQHQADGSQGQQDDQEQLPVRQELPPAAAGH